MTNSPFPAKQTALFCILLCLFCTNPSLGQSSAVDSLQRVLSFAKDDTSKVWLLLSLSGAYMPNDREKALLVAQDAVSLADRLNDKNALAYSHDRIGTLQRRGRQFDSALVHLKKAGRLFNETDNTLKQADVWMDMGICHYSSGRTAEGVTALETSRSLYIRLIPSANSVIDSLARRGASSTYHFSWYAYYLVGAFEKGLDELRKCDTLLIQIRGQDRSPNLYNNFGATYRAMGEYDKALEYYFKGLDIAKRLNAWEDQQRLHNNIAVVYSNRGEYNITREHLLQALNILTTYQKHDTRSLAHAYGNLAGIETKLGRYANALEKYLKALKLFEVSSQILELADFLVEFSEYYSLQSDYSNATNHLNRALGYYRRINNSTGVSHVLFQLGKIATAQQHLDKALEYHTQSLDMRKRGTEKLYVALSMGETGNVLLLMVQEAAKADSVSPASVHSLIDSAASLFRQGVELSRNISDESTIANCLSGLGKAEMLRSNWVRAAEYFEESIHLADSLGLKRELYETYALMAEVSAKLNRHDEAYRYHQLYSAFKDSVFNETSSKQLKETQAKYDTEKKDLEINSLNQQNEIAVLKTKQQEVALKEAALQNARKETDIKLLNQAKELQQQQLLNANNALTERELEAKAKSAELEVAQKEKLLQEHNLQQQKLVMYGSIALAVLTIAFGVVVFSRFQLRKELDKRSAILDERRRISSDMHDDLGSSLSTIALLSQVMRQHARNMQDQTEVEKISVAAQQSLEKMSEIVWSLNPRNDKLGNLVAYLRKYAVEYFENSPVKCTVTMSGSIPDLEITGEQRRNVFLTVKESLHNIIKHSRATCAELRFEFQDHTLQLSVHDNGKGLDTAAQNMFGNGIMNMQRRMKEAGGEVTIENKNGTTVRLNLPLA